MHRNTHEELAAGLAERVHDRGRVHPQRDQEGEQHLKITVFGGQGGENGAKAEGQAGHHEYQKG